MVQYKQDQKLIHLSPLNSLYVFFKVPWEETEGGGTLQNMIK